MPWGAHSHGDPRTLTQRLSTGLCCHRWNSGFGKKDGCCVFPEKFLTTVFNPMGTEALFHIVFVFDNNSNNFQLGQNASHFCSHTSTHTHTRIPKHTHTHPHPHTHTNSLALALSLFLSFYLSLSFSLPFLDPIYSPNRSHARLNLFIESRNVLTLLSSFCVQTKAGFELLA